MELLRHQIEREAQTLTEVEAVPEAVDYLATKNPSSSCLMSTAFRLSSHLVAYERRQEREEEDGGARGGRRRRRATVEGGCVGRSKEIGGAGSSGQSWRREAAQAAAHRVGGGWSGSGQSVQIWWVAAWPGAWGSEATRRSGRGSAVGRGVRMGGRHAREGGEGARGEGGGRVPE